MKTVKTFITSVKQRFENRENNKQIIEKEYGPGLYVLSRLLRHFFVSTA